jgi:hypothetical protein
MNKLCVPAFVYVLFESIINIYLLITGKLGVFSGLFKLLFIYLWILVLQYLYITRGWKIFSWILVLLPLMINGFLLVQSLKKEIVIPAKTTATNPEKTTVTNPEKTTVTNPEKTTATNPEKTTEK